MKLQQHHLHDLATGAAFLATGGGGDPYLSMLCARQALADDVSVDLITMKELADDAIIVAVGAVGAPTTSLELLPSVDDPAKALAAYQAHTGQHIDAIVAFEIGGGNSLIPVAAAAAAGIPLIDGDGMGRALPEVQMMTYSIAGISPTPSVALDYAGNSQLFDAMDVFDYEEQIRRFAMQRGGMITTVEFCMTAAELSHCLVPNTVSLAIAIGAVLNQGHGNAAQLMEPIAQLFSDTAYGRVMTLVTGTVTDQVTSVEGGYDIGYATIRSEHDGNDYHIDIKNEYLTLMQGGRVLASVPDLITILDTETGMPINGERLQYGQRVTVIGIGCPHHFRTPEALAVVGPRCFGFNVDFIPIETLHTDPPSNPEGIS